MSKNSYEEKQKNGSGVLKIPYSILCNDGKKRPVTKSLEGQEFRLNFHPWSMSEMAHNATRPEQIILAFDKLEVGTRLYVNDMEKLSKEEKKKLIEIIQGGDYIEGAGRRLKIDHIQDMGDEVIIEAIGKGYEPFYDVLPEKDTTDLIQKIVPRIDFSRDSLREKIIEMLMMVFLPRQLKEMLEEDEIEILMFEEQMYLKVKNKAYRL